jgi:hypothetical protein
VTASADAVTDNASLSASETQPARSRILSGDA